MINMSGITEGPIKLLSRFAEEARRRGQELGVMEWSISDKAGIGCEV